MKSILTSIIISAGLILPVYAADVPHETKKVCVDKVEKGQPVKGKDGKVVQVCKDVKVHKKLEGTKVPEKK